MAEDDRRRCAPGQRWISNTEPELGLGIVFEVADRRVVVTFPAGNERRTYVLDNAPLTRVRYRVADRVRGEDGTEVIVSEIIERDSCLVYRGLTALGGSAELHEIDLDSFVQFSQPLDRLLLGHFDKNARCALRGTTLLHRHRLQTSAACGLLGPRVQLLPHQFYIAHEVAARHAPRVLLADEVGLGKTIEAGLILHRLLYTGRARRALILVPDHLVHQWLVEMRRRFNLDVSIIDAEVAEELEASGEPNPFDSAQIVLAPLSFLADDETRLRQACDAGWDLTIVDEAHHLAWDESAPSAAFTAVSRLSEHSDGLLLLTATPQQLGVAGHFARLVLLDPHRYTSLEEYLAEEARYAEISTLVGSLVDDHSDDHSDDQGDGGDDRADGEPDDALLERVAAYLGAERVAAIRADRGPETARRLVAELLDHHGTGRVLFRNCRDNIAGFPERRLDPVALPLPAAWRGVPALPAPAQLTPERGRDESWLGLDPRAAWLNDWLKQHRGDKTLIICASAETAQDLEAWLRLRQGHRTAVFHEDMDLIQRDRAAAYFADPEEDAQALVCSEIGSEGRNFQFARHLVLFDLPLNPDLLEQRIGRLDRIGQRHAVEIHVPYLEGTAAAVLLRWLHEGIDAFERICPAAAALFDEFRDDLLAAMAAPDDAAAIESLVQRTAARAAELHALMQRGRDRLLELNSFDAGRAASIIAAVNDAERGDELREYMDRVFDEFGVEHEDHGADSRVLQPGDHMSCEAFPGLPDGGLTVTFDRDEAQGRDDMQFLTWEHPMVSGAMDMVLGGEFGNAGFGVMRHPEIAAGELLVECLFALVCPAPAELRIEQYLAESVIRLVIGAAGEDVGNSVPRAWLDGAVREVPPATAQKVISRMGAQIEQQAELAKHMAEAAQERIVDAALGRMRERIDGERERLRQLAARNPAVRSEEIDYFERLGAECERYLRAGQVKLDAVRVVVAT